MQKEIVPWSRKASLKITYFLGYNTRSMMRIRMNMDPQVHVLLKQKGKRKHDKDKYLNYLPRKKSKISLPTKMVSP